MTVTHGMNPDEVERLGHLLKSKADLVRRLTTSVDQLASRTTWRGTTATRFLQVEWPRLRARLIAVARDMQGFGQSAINNANEQRHVSASAGAGAGSGTASHARSGGPGAPQWTFPIPAIEPGKLLDQVALGLGVVDVAGMLAVPRFASTVIDRQALAEMARATKTPGRFGAALAVVGTGVDSYAFGQALANGDADATWRRGVDVAFDIGSLNPYVAIGRLGWDIGWEIGLFIDEKTGMSDAIAADVLDNHLMDRYHTTSLTPEQAAEVSKRYDGVEGFGRYMFDSGRTAWRNIKAPFTR